MIMQAAPLPNTRHKTRRSDLRRPALFRIMSVSASSSASTFTKRMRQRFPGQIVMGSTTGFWLQVPRILRPHYRRRRQPSPPSSITICQGALDDIHHGESDLASQLRAVHEQYRAGLVSEKEFRRAKANMLVLVLRRRSEASEASRSQDGSSSSSGFFTMSSPSEFRSQVDTSSE
jgi:hypothetical protein